MPENAVLIDERLEASPLGSILQEYVVSDFKLSMWIPSELGTITTAPYTYNQQIQYIISTILI